MQKERRILSHENSREWDGCLYYSAEDYSHSGSGFIPLLLSYTSSRRYLSALSAEFVRLPHGKRTNSRSGFIPLLLSYTSSRDVVLFVFLDKVVEKLDEKLFVLGIIACEGIFRHRGRVNKALQE